MISRDEGEPLNINLQIWGPESPKMGLGASKPEFLMPSFGSPGDGPIILLPSPVHAQFSNHAKSEKSNPEKFFLKFTFEPIKGGFGLEIHQKVEYFSIEVGVKTPNGARKC